MILLKIVREMQRKVEDFVCCDSTRLKETILNGVDLTEAHVGKVASRERRPKPAYKF